MTVEQPGTQSPSTADSFLLSSKSTTAPVTDKQWNDKQEVTANQRQRQRQRQTGLLHLFAFFRWGHCGFLALAVFSALLVAALNATLPVILGFIFEVVAGFGEGTLDGTSAMRQVAKWCLVLCGMGGGAWLANTLLLSTWVVFGELQGWSARNRVFQSLNGKEMEWYDSRSDGVSSLFVRIESQIKELQLATSQVFGFLASETFCSLASIALALYYSWKLTLVLLATIPVSFAVMSLATRKLEPAIHEQKMQLARASKYAVASVTAIDLVKVFNGYDQEVWQYMQAIRMASKPYLTQARSNSIQMGYLAFWIVGLFVVGFWYGVNLINQGWSAGSILTTFYATLNAFQGIEAFLPQWLVLARGMSAGAELGDLAFSLGSKMQPQEMQQGAERPEGCVGDIEMNSVCHVTPFAKRAKEKLNLLTLREIYFAYPSNPAELAIDGASLHFPAGRMTFLVGRSGSGKSTIGNLLVKFYAPRRGQITIDGCPLQTLDTAWIRSNVTLIQQSSVLFSETLMANVALGHPSPEQATRAQVVAACDSALLQSTLAALPKGLDTIVGPNGHSLSGGQKQRMALARARLRNTPVLILDEVTSGLDRVSRSLIMEAIREWRRGSTTIIITHDVSQIQCDDFVYVMNHGHLVQKGSRRELAKDQGGLFASLVASGGGEPETAETWKEEQPTTKGARPTTAPQEDERRNLSPLPANSAAKITRRLSQILRQSWQPSPTPAPNMAPTLNPLSSIAVATQYSNIMNERASWNVPATNEEMTLTMGAAHRQRRNSETTEHAERGAARLRPRSPGRTTTIVGSRNRDASPPGALPAERNASPTWVLSRDDTGDGAREALRDQTYRASFSSLSMRRASTATSRNRNLSIDLVEATGVSVQAARVHDGDDEKLRRRRAPSPVVSEQASSDSDTQATLKQIMVTVWPALRHKQRIACIVGICCCLAVAAANPAFSYCFAKLLAATWSGSSERSASGRYWALILLAVGSAEGIATYYAHYLLECVGQAWVNSLRIESLKRILHQPPVWFRRPASSPHLVAECIDRNAEEMRNIVGRFLPTTVIVTCMMASSVVWAVVVSWKLTLVALAPGPLVFASLRGFSLVYARWERICNAAADETSTILAETFLNIRVVRALAVEDTFSTKHRASAAKTYSLGVKKAASSGPFYGCYQAMNFFLVALVFYYGMVMLTINSEISVDKIVQVINLLLFSIGSAAGLLGSIPQITAARVTAAQMLEFATLPCDGDDKAGGSVRLLSPLPVRMDALSFAYPSQPANMVLHRVSLQIEAGTCTCIVGASGCGKSTLISLLLGLYPPSTLAQSSTPALAFGGVPYQDIDMRIMRSRLAFVPQQPFLFPGTVVENILYGLPETSPLRSRGNAEDAAKAVGLHDFIASLPEGYLSLLGEGGLALSGGQAQRINIARALARKPLLLVMDEPTSALDAESAELVRQTVQSVMRASAAKTLPLPGERSIPKTRARARSRSRPATKTMPRAMAIVIGTHSREMMKIADNVVMLSEGSVVEQGPYSDLMARRGRLAAMASGGVWLDSGWMAAEPPTPRRRGYEGFKDVDWT